MSDVTQQPIRFLLSDMDGTLLLPDHSLSQRTIEAVRALREAGVLFSLATGRPPKAMLQQIEALGVDLPTAAFNGGNDPAMFHRAGLSIAMGQAEDAVKRQADVVTGANTEDGAAQAIERFILSTV